MIRALRILLIVTGSLIIFSQIAEHSRCLGANTPPQTDLYKVYVECKQHADILSGSGADVLWRVKGGYLVLADQQVEEYFASFNLEFEIIKNDVNRDGLALDIYGDEVKPDSYSLIYEEGNNRLYDVGSASQTDLWKNGRMITIPDGSLPVIYKDASLLIAKSAVSDPFIDELISKISKDSLISYSEFFQSYNGRYCNTRNWRQAQAGIASKLTSFGCDSVVNDTLTALIDGSFLKCRNIIAYKTGTDYPHDQIIIGAHYDTYPEDSPGADDNGSGLVAVLEIARALADIDTKMTIIFILFDAEEHGLWGSMHYAREAAERSDRIVCVFNLDMIGHYLNETDLKVLFPTSNSEAFAQVLSDLAVSYESIGLACHISAGTGNTDLISFDQYGFDGIGIYEYLKSDIYHSPHDSTTYLNYDYMTRITKAILATAYVLNNTVVPLPDLIFYYLDTIPSVMLPGEEYPIRVQIEEYSGGQLVPGTALIHYQIDDGEFYSEPLIDEGGGNFGFSMPAPDCRSRLKYNISAEEYSGGVIYFPSSDEFHESLVYTDVNIMLQDNFNTDMGWTVSGNASHGHWERWTTNRQPYLNQDHDFDGSGKCYLTEADTSTYQNQFENDVDDGYTILDSPLFDATSGDVVIDYAVWYRNWSSSKINQDDIFKISLIHGERLYLVKTLGPIEGADGEWLAYTLRVNDKLTPTEPIGIRFVASDYGLFSWVEAAVDAVTVTCYSYSPKIITDSLPEATLDSAYIHEMEAVGCAEPFIWADKNGDLAGTGLSLSSDGLLAGIPTVSAPINFTAVVEDLEGLTGECQFTLNINFDYFCGDANSDESINIGDAVYIINHIFKNGPAPDPIQSCNVNCDGACNVGDAVYLINHVFKGGNIPCEDCL
ncbi:MAG: M20/M25/M40 family metallo-hydrolase [candidate division Zixibacteria bacterium]